MRLKLYTVLCLALGVGLSACGNVEVDGEGESSGPAATAEMALNVDLKGDTDVVGVKFKAIQIASCGPYDPTETGLVYEATESLEELFLPGDNDTFDEDGYTSPAYLDGSKHHFADHLFVVEPGCYKVIIKPIKEDGTVSNDCAIAKRSYINVEKDKINEVHLISQCRGVARTTLDIVGSLNHPPELDLDIQKFACAGSGVYVCATATDPDKDPAKIKFYELPDKYATSTTNSGPSPIPYEWLEHPEYDAETGKTTQCATIPTEYADTKEYKVVAKDLGWDGYKHVPIEDLLAEQHNYASDFNPDKSRASLKFPVHGIGHCIPAGMAFIGTTMGADLKTNRDHDPDLDTNPHYGMSEFQAKTVAKNAVDYVNPNLLGDPDPRILIVLDDNNQNEDPEDAEYIKQLLEKQLFTNVTLIEEPQNGADPDGLKPSDVVGYKIVWLVNPGYPIDDELTYHTLQDFRLKGGGVIVSGDDASQAIDVNGTLPMTWFSFLEYQGDNGTNTCGHPTDNNAGAKFFVEIIGDRPLAQGLMGNLSFPYGNDIDDAKRVGQGETLNAVTKGLVSDPDCIVDHLDRPYDVMTTVPSPLVFEPAP